MRFDCIHCRKATTKPQSVKGAFLRMLTEIQEVNIELERLDRKIISYYDDVDKMTTSIKDFSLELNNTIKVLFDISLLLIKEKEAQFKLEK